MKRTLMVLGVAAAVLTSQNVLAQGETIPLAEARAQIGAIVEDPASMTGVMRQLSPEDQLSLLSDVNSAIASIWIIHRVFGLRSNACCPRTKHLAHG